MTEKRVAVIINSLVGGGAERVLSVLLARIAAWQAEGSGPPALDGVRLHLVLLDRVDEKYEIPEAIPRTNLDCGERMLTSTFRLWRMLRRLRPALTVSFLTRANCANILAARAFGFPCVVSERINTTHHLGAGARGRVLRWLVRALYPRADGVIAVSEGVREDLTASYGVAAARVAVIPNPYDIDGIRALAGREPEWLPPGGRPYLLAVGRLTAAKNYAMLIRAFAAARVDCDLVILGQGEERAALAGLAHDLGVAGRVHLPGFARNPYPIFARSAGFVLSSNVEGFPNALAEAMVLGCRIVATDCPSGPSELLGARAPAGSGVVRTGCGFLVPVGDGDAMRAALGELTQTGRDEDIGAAAARRMEDYRVDAIAAEYVEVIARACRGAARG